MIIKTDFSEYKYKKWMGIRLYFVLMAMIGFIAAAGLATIITFVLDVFQVTLNIPPAVWVFLLTIVIGGGVVLIVSFVLDPIERLSKAMSRVAQGDFKVSLSTESKIKEIRQSYDAFNLMTQELDATQTLQSDFVANVSHEIKTPITAIEGYSMLLQNSNATAQEQQVYVEKILFNTRRLSSLVGNILLLSKLENQAIQTGQTSFRLDEQIRQALLLHEPAWSKRETEFDVELEPVEYIGSRDLLLHVWSNLISNAVKFSPQGGEVKLRLHAQPDLVIFCIEDSGPGISEEDRSKIFGKFYQADTSHKQEGNGLGLALVQQILDITRGSIAVENRPEGGARFTVYLPTGHEA